MKRERADPEKRSPLRLSRYFHDEEACTSGTHVPLTPPFSLPRFFDSTASLAEVETAAASVVLTFSLLSLPFYSHPDSHSHFRSRLRSRSRSHSHCRSRSLLSNLNPPPSKRGRLGPQTPP